MIVVPDGVICGRHSYSTSPNSSAHSRDRLRAGSFRRSPRRRVRLILSDYYIYYYYRCMLLIFVYPLVFSLLHVSNLMFFLLLRNRVLIRMCLKTIGLFFLSKLIEKVISSRIPKHIAYNDLIDKFHSAYRCVNGSYLVLLYLTAACGTIKHNNLMVRLDKYVVITTNTFIPVSWLMELVILLNSLFMNMFQ